MYRKVLIAFALLNLIFLFAGCNKKTINPTVQNSSSQSANDVSFADPSISSEKSSVSQTDGEVFRHETEAQYFPINDTETKAIGNIKFNFWLTIPSDWEAFDRSENGDGYFIECGNKNVDMRVYGAYDVLPEDFYINSNDGSTVSEFVFDSGIIGWQIAKANHYTKFLYKTDGRYITFYLDYENDLEWFEKNQEEILSTAKTLRDGKR